MRKTLAVARKELRQASRDPLSLAMLLGVPAMMLLLYGFALNFDVRHVRLGVQDLSKSPASRELVASFVNSTYFDQVAELPAGSDLDLYIEMRNAKAVLVIPENFATELAAHRTVPVQLLLDGADAQTASTVIGYAESLVADENIDLMTAATGRRGARPIAYEPRVWYNPELKSTQFLVPGLVGFILMLTAAISTALSVVREKERGTMEQLRITSLRPGQLILGKVLPYLGISLAATAVILIAARVLFGVVIRGPILHLFIATFVYLLGALGWGLMISSLSDSQAIAFQLATLSSMLPAIFLSGFIFPIRAMPAVLRALTYAVPARYYLIIMRGVILKGAGLGSYPQDMLFLVIFATIVLGLAYVRLVKSEG